MQWYDSDAFSLCFNFGKGMLKSGCILVKHNQHIFLATSQHCFFLSVTEYMLCKANSPPVKGLLNSLTDLMQVITSQS